MTQIDELLVERCPNGVQFKSLGEVATYAKGVTFAKSDQGSDGSVPVLRANNITLSSNTLNFEDVIRISGDVRVRPDQHLYAKDILISAASGSRAHVGKVAYIYDDLDPYVFGGFMGVLRSGDELESRFLFHVLAGGAFAAYLERALSTSTINNLNSSILRGFRVPVPPVLVQREIVRILDQFTELEAELGAALSTESQIRLVQQAHYRERILGRTASVRGGASLSDLVEFTNGKAHERLVVPDGAVALLTARFISTAGRLARWVNAGDALTPARVGDIAMVMSDLPNGRALARCFYVEEDGKYTANQRVCLLRVRDQSSLSSRWLYHFLERNPQFLAYDNGQDQTHLKKGQILDIRVPEIPLAEQERSVVALARLDSAARDIVTNLDSERQARHAQYEYYRDKLLTFEETVV